MPRCRASAARLTSEHGQAVHTLDEPRPGHSFCPCLKNICANKRVALCQAHRKQWAWEKQRAALFLQGSGLLEASLGVPWNLPERRAEDSRGGKAGRAQGTAAHHLRPAGVLGPSPSARPALDGQGVGQTVHPGTWLI